MGIMQKQSQIVYSLAMTNYLINKGFHIIEVKFHKYKQNTTVFFFENTQELQDAIADYIQFHKE